MADPVHFTATLPTKRMAADCLFTDREDRLLILEPTYKPTWEIPGGVVETDESPRLAAIREVKEEIGLVVEPGRLVAVDWIARSGEFTEVVAFLFDCGVLGDADIDRIVLQPSEVRGVKFVSLEEAERFLDAELFARVAAGLKGRLSGSPAYLENGLRAFGA